MQNQAQLAVAQTVKTYRGVRFAYVFDPDPLSNNGTIAPPPLVAQVPFYPGGVRVEAQNVDVRAYPDEASQGWRVGYLQTVLTSKHIFTYTNATHRMQVVQTLPKPMRDGPSDDSIWMSVSNATTSPGFVRTWAPTDYVLSLAKLEDIPFAKGASEGPSGMVLTKLTGRVNFMLWLAAQCQKEGLLVLLESYEWHLNFHYLRNENGHFVPQEGNGGYPQLEGAVALERPILSGARANGSSEVTYSQPRPK